MATVYLATDRKHGRAVAVKVLLPELAASLGGDRFLREIELAARLRHPHIVPLFDSGEAGGLLYYVMPQLVGESLRDRLEREKQLPLDDALRLASEVADALSYAHAQGVVHRDIKPENIMLEAGHAVVTDFGIAKAVATEGGTLTETGLTVGTPAYMSPEQAAGASDIDGRADLYSLACVLYEMLAGRPPFVGPTASSLVQQHLTLAPVPLTALRPAVPESVSAAVSRALAKAPADRFNPVAQFSEVLRAPVIGPGAPSASARAPRSRARLAIAAVLVLVAVAAAWVFRDRLGFGSTRIESLAVLPLENLSADASQEYFVNGVHDALIGELSKLAGLSVGSRTSAMAYKGTTKSAPEIARELGVDGLIEGSVFRSGDTVRLQIQLIDARQDRHVFSRSYDRDVRNVLATMGDVATAIAQEVQVSLTAQESSRLARGRDANPAAQEHYLRGKELLYRRDSATVLTAIEELRNAIRLDSTSASAYAALAFGSVFAVLSDQIPSDSIYASFARALAAADRAIAIDPLNPEGHAVRGYLGLYTGAPSDSAERALRRALQLRPSYAEAWGWLAQAIAVRRPREALTATETALRLDPASAGMQIARVVVAFMIDSAQLGHEAAGPLGKLRPDLAAGRIYDAIALLQLRRPDECLSLPGVYAVIRAMCMHAAGSTADAERLLRSTLDAFRAGRTSLPNPWLSIALARMGRLDEAIPMLRLHMERSPVFIPITDGHRLLRTREDPDASRFIGAARLASAQAWSRIVRESRSVRLP